MKRKTAEPHKYEGLADTETENSTMSADHQDDLQEEISITTAVRHLMTNIEAQFTTQENAHVQEITTHIAQNMTLQIVHLHDKQYRTLYHAISTLMLTRILLQTLPLHD